jgi:molybdenum cofactor biosynthesis enzyme MoaA
MRKLTDRYDRLHDYLRISLTDKSNLNSSYSDMLNKARNGSKKKGTLCAEELCRIVRLFTEEFGFKILTARVQKIGKDLELEKQGSLF